MGPAAAEAAAAAAVVAVVAHDRPDDGFLIDRIPGAPPLSLAICHHGVMGTLGGTVLMTDAVIAVLLMVLLLHWLRPDRTALPGTVRVSAEDIGFLAGGPGRAYLTAVGALVESGRMRSRDGRIEVVAGAVGATGLERAVLTGLAAGAHPRGMISLPATAEALLALQDDLADRQLVLTGRRHGAIVLTVGALWLSYVVGWICVVTGAAGDGVGYVVAALLVIGVALIGLTRSVGGVVPARSRALVAHLRRGPVTTTGSRGERVYADRLLVDRGVGMAVALDGADALRRLDPAVASSVAASRVAAGRDVDGPGGGFLGDRRRADSGGGYSGSGTAGCGAGGSSCGGGGGCGGGGCGGGGS